MECVVDETPEEDGGLAMLDDSPPSVSSSPSTEQQQQQQMQLQQQSRNTSVVVGVGGVVPASTTTTPNNAATNTTATNTNSTTINNNNTATTAVVATSNGSGTASTTAAASTTGAVSGNSTAVTCVHQHMNEEGIAPFIVKLYDLVSDPGTQQLISWSTEHNKHAFVVWDTVEFSTTILPRYFKHANFCSFVRQLNIYGFHKIESKDGYAFMHECFRYNCPHLLKHIQRRKPVHKKSAALADSTGIGGGGVATNTTSNVNISDLYHNDHGDSHTAVYKYLLSEIVELQKQNEELQTAVKHLTEMVERSQTREQQLESRLQRIADFLVFYSPLAGLATFASGNQGTASSPPGNSSPVADNKPVPNQQRSPAPVRAKHASDAGDVMPNLQQQQQQLSQALSEAVSNGLLTGNGNGPVSANAGNAGAGGPVLMGVPSIANGFAGNFPWDFAPAVKGAWRYGAPAV